MVPSSTLSPPLSPEHLPTLLNKAEAARFLRVSTRTLDEWRRRGRLKGYNLGKRCVRFRRADILSLVGGLAEGETQRAS